MINTDISVLVPEDVLNLEALMRGELETAAAQVAALMANRVRHYITEPDERGRVIDTSHALLNSIDEEVTAEDRQVLIEVFSTELHAKFIEDGRPPGPLSISIIMEWMLDKGITPREGETLDQAARAIQMKIMREGYEGRHIFARALEDSVDIASAAANRAANRITRRLGGN